MIIVFQKGHHKQSFGGINVPNVVHADSIPTTSRMNHDDKYPIKSGATEVLSASLVTYKKIIFAMQVHPNENIVIKITWRGK